MVYKLAYYTYVHKQRKRWREFIFTTWINKYNFWNYIIKSQMILVLFNSLIRIIDEWKTSHSKFIDA